MRTALLVLAILLMPVAVAHAGETHSTEEEAATHEAESFPHGSINPAAYFSAGHPVAGTVALLLWLLCVSALSLLLFLTLGRLFL